MYPLRPSHRIPMAMMIPASTVPLTGQSESGYTEFTIGLTGTDTITAILLGTGWPTDMDITTGMYMSLDIGIPTGMDIAIDTPTGLFTLPDMSISVTFIHPAGCITYGIATDTPTGLSMLPGICITDTLMHPAMDITCAMGMSAGMDTFTIMRKGMVTIIGGVMPACGPCRIAIRRIPRTLPANRPAVWSARPTRQNTMAPATPSSGPNTFL